MDHLWAPWREAYITRLVKRVKGCLFCRLLRENKDKKNLIFLRTSYSFGVLNRFPYNNGHAMVLPLRHVGSPEDLTPEESQDLWETLCYTKKLLDHAFRSQGYNIGMNVGKAAGAGEPGHLHFHIVPRWRGDVNFMPTIGKTKVISQSLRASYNLLVDGHRRCQCKAFVKVKRK